MIDGDLYVLFSRMVKGIYLTTLRASGYRSLWPYERWGERVKSVYRRALLSAAEELSHSTRCSISLLDTPYSSSIIGKGEGANTIGQETVIGEAKEGQILCLVDIVDGTWSLNAGMPSSASTTIAFSGIRDRSENLAGGGDIRCGDFIAGAIMPHESPGFIFGMRERRPEFLVCGGTRDSLREPLFLLQKTQPKEIRFVLDLFTTQTQQQLQESLTAVTSLILEWADFVRLYGAGVEVAAMLQPKYITPAIGAYVAANQKTDNIAPMLPLIRGAGGIVTDWWGESVDRKRLLDRTYVVMAANPSLHANIMGHLSRVPRIKEGV